MLKIIYILIAVIVALVLGFVCYIAAAETKKRRKLEKELQEAKANAEKQAKATEQANQTKADARTGDIERDVNFMAGKLREYAHK